MSIHGAPIPITLSGVDYLFSPLDKSDIDTLDAWVRKRHIQIVRSSFTDDMSEESKRLELSIAHQAASAMQWTSPIGARLMATIEGMSYLLWLSLRKQHPAVTRAEMFKLLESSPENIRSTNEALSESGKANPSHGRSQRHPTTRGQSRSKRSKKRRKGKR